MEESIRHLAEQIDQLRDDLEDAETERDLKEAEADKWYEAYERKSSQCNKIKFEAMQKAEDMNTDLRDKALIYLSLINEYELYLKAMPKAAQDRINNLKRRGGIIV